MKKRSNSTSHYAVCINNEDYKASLEKGKLYRTIPDKQATSHGYIRVIDESGEDYGYSATRFIPIKLPRVLQKALFTDIAPALKHSLHNSSRRTQVRTH